MHCFLFLHESRKYNFVNKINETKGHIASLFISNPKESIPAAVVPARYDMHSLA